MKNWKFIMFQALTFSLIVSGCQKNDNADAEETFVPVEITEAAPSSIQTVLSYAGQIKANQTSAVYSKTSGEVKEVFFDLGDAVNEGDILFSMDEKSILDQIKQLEAQLAISNAGVTSAQTSLKNASGGQLESQQLQMETSIENAKIQVENAKIQLDNAKIQLNNAELSLNDVKTKYDNTKTLYEAGVAAKKDYEAAELGYNQALAAYNQALHAVEQTTNAYTQAKTTENQAQDSYDIYMNKITKETENTYQNAVTQAQASRESVMVQLNIARDALKDTNVKSPITGVVGAKKINAKDTISPALDAFTIVEMSSVNVEVKVSEQIIPIIYPGQEVSVYVNSISNEPFQGIIKNTSPTADSTSTYTVNIEMQNPENKIKPGMFADVRFVKEHKENTLVVPRNTVIENENETVVFIVEGDTAKKVPVITGIDNGVDIEIVSGINNGDKIVTKGQTYLDDANKVKIIEQETNETSKGE